MRLPSSTFAWTLGLSAALSACGSPSGAARGTEGSSDGAPSTCHEGKAIEDCAGLSDIQLDSALPPSRGNPHADSDSAALLGFRFFFDVRFSGNQNVRCESCHSTDYAFADNQPVSLKGVSRGKRNAPTVLNAARYTTFMWDGRADSLWSQPLLAIEDPTEMAFTRLELVHLVQSLYSKQYIAAFGEFPDVTDAERFPPTGKPGDAAFDGMAAQDQSTINNVFANMGKALEAYMRKIVAGDSPVDMYLAGDHSALNEKQVAGMYVFASAGCLNCHSGPQLSDNEFHNLGVPAAADQEPDPGRAQGVLTLERSTFNDAGPFFEGPRQDTPGRTPILGGFRTPSLRNLVKAGPYGHNGTFPTLEAMVDFHLDGGGANSDGYVGVVDPLLEKKSLSPEEREALVEFLKALQGKYPALPWGQWPNGNG